MFMLNSANPFRKGSVFLLPVVILGLGLVACASVPKAPTDALQAADTAIKQAEDARVADYASAELSSAREKLASAHALADKAKDDKDEKEMWQARRLAEESQSDAELATAQAQEAHAKSVDKEMQQNNDTLQQELQRKSGS